MLLKLASQCRNRITWYSRGRSGGVFTRGSLPCVSLPGFETPGKTRRLEFRSTDVVRDRKLFQYVPPPGVEGWGNICIRTPYTPNLLHELASGIRQGLNFAGILRIFANYQTKTKIVEFNGEDERLYERTTSARRGWSFSHPPYLYTRPVTAVYFECRHEVKPQHTCRKLLIKISCAPRCTRASIRNENVDISLEILNPVISFTCEK